MPVHVSVIIQKRRILNERLFVKWKRCVVRLLFIVFIPFLHRCHPDIAPPKTGVRPVRKIVTFILQSCEFVSQHQTIQYWVGPRHLKAIFHSASPLHWRLFLKRILKCNPHPIEGLCKFLIVSFGEPKPTAWQLPTEVCHSHNLVWQNFLT